MVQMVNELDWENTPLGPIGEWPESIRSAVSLALGSTFQLVVLSGPELVYIYNDASACIFGAKHPWALGKPASVVWAEAWGTIGPMLQSVVDSGRALRHDDLLMVLERYGYREECYFTFSYSPIWGPDSSTGVFISVLETSQRVVNERRLRTLSELAAAVARGRGELAYAALADSLAVNLYDLPCTALYLVDSHRAFATLAFETGVANGCTAAPAQVCLKPRDGRRGPVARAFDTGVPQEFDAAEVLAPDAVCGVWPEPPRVFIAYPLVPPGASHPCGIFVAGVNPRQALDSAHRSFLDFVAGHAATAVANAEAVRFEQERLDAMAELARSKNAFFANASHELRTPLTLILGPLETLLDSAEAQGSDDMREALDMARRNALRMKRLVNSLLDFASIEAGRMPVRLAGGDLAQLTRGLAGLFQSAFDAAGVGFSISVPDHPVEVVVDRDMWEKVVLNLLSNALKFTPSGRVELELRDERAAVVLTVRDTGVGIKPADLPFIFDRFYRGQHDGGRAGAEGTGIGLALSAELVRLMGGTLDASSEEGQGASFVVRLPARVAAGDGLAADAPPLAQDQAAAILDDVRIAAAERAARPAPAPEAGEAILPADAGLLKVVVIDDNEDIVRYLKRLLQESCSVVSAGDAEAGLEAIRSVRPDIVLLDVMMPGIDGFALLRIIRADEAIQSVPVIMLSAHAGEDARLEALAAGADDYLVKPFSARELVAMVRSHIRLMRIRRAAIEREARLLTEIAETRSTLENVIEGTSDAFVHVDSELRVLAVNEVGISIIKQPRDGLIGRSLRDAVPRAKLVTDAMVRALQERRTIGVQYQHAVSGRWFSVRCYPAGEGVIVFANEITQQKQAEARLLMAHQELEHRVMARTHELNSAKALLEAVFDRAPAAIAMTDTQGRIVRANAAFERLVGMSAHALAMLDIGSLADPVDAAARGERIGQLLAGEVPDFMIEMRYSRADGSVIWVENFAAAICGDGGARYVVEIVRDITRRKRSADEVLASRNELRLLYDWLQRVRNDERIALAREVHDQLGQILSAAKIDIKLLMENIQAGRSGLQRNKVIAELRSASSTLDQAIDTARSIATELRPPEIENQGLYSAVSWHARDFERRTRVRVELSLPAATGGPDCPAAVALFRIFKEALTNILRHARATAVAVSLHRRGGFILLRVRDNGVGIRPERVRAAGTLGLVGMRERAHLAHGRVGIRRLPSGGTLVSALLPVPGAAHEKHLL
ncbi:MAG: ATP-binding protein [Telluria sp.]